MDLRALIPACFIACGGSVDSNPEHLVTIRRGVYGHLGTSCDTTDCSGGAATNTMIAAFANDPDQANLPPMTTATYAYGAPSPMASCSVRRNREPSLA